MSGLEISRKVRELTPEILPYTAVIEGPDGYTFEQDYYSYEELFDMLDAFGEGYKIVCLF